MVVVARRWLPHGKELICVLSHPRSYRWGSDIEAENIQHFVVYDTSSGAPKAIYKEDISAAIVNLGIVGDQFEITLLGGLS